MIIRQGGIEDIDSIRFLAHEIWPEVYKEILAAEQIEFMLQKMYSTVSLEKQFLEGTNFLIAESSKPVGFASYSLSDSSLMIYKVHKLYVLSEVQGQGIGSQLLDCIRQTARSEGAKILELNVNRNNTALHFYKRYGFEIFAEEDIPYYQFTLNDYVMRMPV